ISTSAGKDSLVCAYRVVTLAAEAGCLDKVVMVHADLGEESEWPGVRELAQRQAERWGVEFIVVQADRGLLGLVEKRGMWPDAARRLCTSTLKRDKIAPLFKQITDALGLDEQALILSALGIRAAESPARARKLPLSIDMRASTGQRMVLTWHPILELSEADVWQQIADATLEYHPVYDALIPRLSCVFCVLAGRDVLVRAVRLCWALGLDLPARYAALEEHIGHKFREKLSVAEIVAEAARVLRPGGVLIATVDKDAAHDVGSDIDEILRPHRSAAAASDRAQLITRHAVAQGLAPASGTRFTGHGQGATPRDTVRKLRAGYFASWFDGDTAAATTIAAALTALPDQDRPRDDPRYRLARFVRRG
ncbi:phosphoadenosine phosphosulfate reductase family protein, partial [Streptomyces albidoflavus]